MTDLFVLEIFALPSPSFPRMRESIGLGAPRVDSGSCPPKSGGPARNDGPLFADDICGVTRTARHSRELGNPGLARTMCFPDHIGNDDIFIFRDDNATGISVLEKNR